MNNPNPWRVQATLSDGSTGMVQPATLRLATADEAETIAERYRKHELQFVSPGRPGAKYRAVKVDSNGYIVRWHITFGVTYDIVTQESAADGDTAESGFIAEHIGLREALKEVADTRTNYVDGVDCIECDSRPAVRVRWVTVTNGMEYLTGAVESRALHIPDSVSDATSRRIARLVGARL